jgi:hypothetical protein
MLTELEGSLMASVRNTVAWLLSFKYKPSNFVLIRLRADFHVNVDFHVHAHVRVHVNSSLPRPHQVRESTIGITNAMAKISR